MESRQRQVLEVPPLQPHVTEYRCEGTKCSNCGVVTYGERPEEAAIREADAVHTDETSWSEKRLDGRAHRAWLWTVATPLLAVFKPTGSRCSEVIKSLLGEDFSGLLITDRWSAYNWHEPARCQLCWSHLRRDFQGFIARGGDEGAHIGMLLMAERDRMFDWWARVRVGTLERRLCERRMKRVGDLLQEDALRAEPKTAGMAREILKLESAMWTFTHVESLQPNNNYAQQITRHAVMYRKPYFGTQCEGGSRFVERVLTAVTSLRLQRRNVLEFLTAAIHSHRLRVAAPSLFPNHAPNLAAAA